MNTFIICGSGRKDSNSQKFTNHLASILPDLGINRISTIDFEHADIPMVGKGDIKPDALTPFQAELVSGWENADLIFMVVPEYNWTTNGEFTNALHQLGGNHFAHLFNNKVFAMAGVSAGRGGRMPALEMSMVVSKLINFLNQYSIVSPRIYESHETNINLTQDGVSTGNTVYEKSVIAFASYAINVCKRWNGIQ
jgi:chromate reductase